MNKKLANSIRMLSVDAIANANSGHSGMPLGMADIAAVLWLKFLRHDPNHTTWVNRDRFVLSNGHGSMLLYSLLHLTGYNISIADLKSFRTLHSKTPGHPEFGVTPGVEATTGPLGQGLAMAVGMALGEKLLSTQFNTIKFNIIDHYVYCFVGDGCLMEGISHEACSLAGTLNLHKLIVFWDNNNISIDGKVENCCKDDIPMRFQSYNWHVIEDIDGHDSQAISAAISVAKNTHQPSLLCCKTTIGFGSTFAGSNICHGAILDSEEIKKIRQNLEWPYEPFYIPEDIYETFRITPNNRYPYEEWQNLWLQYQQEEPALAQEFIRRQQKKIPDKTIQNLEQLIAIWLAQHNNAIATRKASQQIINTILPTCPELLVGSADLGDSTGTLSTTKELQIITALNFDGNYIHYGVREFAMAAIANGLSLYGGFLPVISTFLAFIDYARGALRLGAIMQQKVIYVLSHDSILLGEDGPTHQPIEHLNILRNTPNITVWRPADPIEAAISWQQILQHNHIACLVLTRQNVIPLDHTNTQISNMHRGGYLLRSCTKSIATIIATGSEVYLAMQVSDALEENNIYVNVVSMPSCEQFKKQDLSYKTQILPKSLPIIVIEASSSSYWYQFAGTNGLVFGIDTFGYSGPGTELYNHFGFTVENIKERIIKWHKKNAD